MRTMPPLHKASLLVQEDLILMRRGENGWRLAAGSLCFPSSWSLTEKFGKPMHEIHEPVPAFGPGTRTAGLIDRMFDNLQVGQPVERFNWSIQAGDALYHPLSNVGASTAPPAGRSVSRCRCGRARLHPRRAPDAAQAAGIGRHPVHHPHPSRSDGLAEKPSGPAELAASFAEQLMALDEAQLDYKGLTADRDRLVEALTAIG